MTLARSFNQLVQLDVKAMTPGRIMQPERYLEPASHGGHELSICCPVFELNRLGLDLLAWKRGW